MKLNKWAPMRRFDVGRWWLTVWTDRTFWKLKPVKKSYWSGGLTSIHWGPFEVGHDSRRNWVEDMRLGKRAEVNDTDGEGGG